MSDRVEVRGHQAVVDFGVLFATDRVIFGFKDVEYQRVFIIKRTEDQKARMVSQETMEHALLKLHEDAG